MTMLSPASARAACTTIGRPVACAALVLAAVLTPLSAGAATQVEGTLLAVPDQPYVRAVDVNELGVIVGTTAPGLETYTPGTAGYRWLAVGNRFVRQRLQTPSDAFGVSVTGVNRFGEPAGTAGVPGTDSEHTAFRAIRWPVTGRDPVTIGAADSRTSAVGDNAWGVAYPTNGFITGSGEIVDRNGTRTSVDDFPELPGRIHTVTRIGSRDTALVTAVSGVGGGTSGQAAVVQAGRAKTLPVQSLVFYGGFCVSDMRPDGTIAYSGFGPGDGRFDYYMSIHRGGVPGTEEPLPTDGRVASIGCQNPDTLAKDDTVAGFVNANAARPQEAAVWTGGTMTTLGVPDGFYRSEAVAAATGGRVVVVAIGADPDAPQSAYLYRDGARLPLVVPAGWSLLNIVELTDRGLVVGNVKNAAGDVCPIAWRT
jgi:hypothetical protein